MSIALKYSKSLWSYNPIPRGCILYLPLWHPNIQHPSFVSIDPKRYSCTSTCTFGSTGSIFSGATTIEIGFQTFTASKGTLIIWIYQAAQNADKYAVGRNTAGTEAGEFALVFHGSSYASKTAFQMVDSTLTRSVCQSNDILSANTWYHMALVWESGATNIMYINGVAQTTTATGRAVPAHATTVMSIGGNGGAGSLVGGAGEVSIHSEKALSPTEVLHHYSHTRGRYQ